MSMKDKPSYLSKAFNARPFGMPIPPNWFGLATFGFLGAFIHPGLWLIGLGLEGIYLWALSQNARFRKVGEQVTAARIKELDEKKLPASEVYKMMKTLSERHAKGSKSFWQ